MAVAVNCATPTFFVALEVSKVQAVEVVVSVPKALAAWALTLMERKPAAGRLEMVLA